MINYILADYKRVVSRIPRIVFLVIYQVIFILYVMNKITKAAGTYTSVSLIEHSNSFFSFWFLCVVCLVDFIQSFSFDFRAKTIQVALGIGISRLQVILAKLIQTTLVMLTDFVITMATFGILTLIAGTPLAGHQLGYIIANGLGSILLSTCSISLLLPLVFRTQNMVMAMVGYFIMAPGVITGAVRYLVRMGPAFLARLQLDRYCHDCCCKLIQTNAIQGTFQLWPVIGAIAWFAIGIYLTWILFRKMELDF